MNLKAGKNGYPMYIDEVCFDLLDVINVSLLELYSFLLLVCHVLPSDLCVYNEQASSTSANHTF